jgi:hypothetical protein
LSWSCPASAAIVTVMSPPITSKQTWFTTSGITGFTLPGMIDEPGCMAGRLISPSPGARAGRQQAEVVADLRQLDRRTRFITARELHEKRPVSAEASTRSGAVITPRRRWPERWRRTASA